VPITYLRALQAMDLPAAAQAIWDAGLAELFARTSNGRLVDVDSPHVIPPPPIRDAVDQMLELLGAS